MKVLIDVNIQGIDRLVVCDNKVQQLTQAKFLCVPDKTLSLFLGHPVVVVSVGHLPIKASVEGL